MAGHCRVLCSWALQGYSAVGHCRDALRLGTAGVLGGWALHPLSIAGVLIGWALQGYLVVAHCRDTLWLGTAGILCGWALQGYLVVGHCGDTLWLVTKVSFQSGEDNIYEKIKQPHCEGGEKEQRFFCQDALGQMSLLATLSSKDRMN